MKKYFLILSFIFLISSVSAFTLTRTLPLYVEPNQKFNVIYEMNDVDNNMYASWSDGITGGCLPSNITNAMTSSMMTKKIVEITAPANVTTCVFDGYFYFQDGVMKNFVKDSVKVGNSNPITTTQTINSNQDTNTVVSNPQGVLSNSDYCSYASKLSFFNLFQNKCTEGTITGILIIWVIYKIK